MVDIFIVSYKIDCIISFMAGDRRKKTHTKTQNHRAITEIKVGE
jgi:hypothetical protein